MAPIATYVFLDLETTGIPSQESNKTKITELSMVAVKRDHMLDTRPGATPRVQHKLTLCFNPGRLVHPDCTEVTGLCNFLLEHESLFNKDTFTMINTFLNRLTKPVCLIAQNGLGFDFPILKHHVDKLKESFSSDLLCADCYHAFYDIMEAAKNVNIQDSSKAESTSSDTEAAKHVNVQDSSKAESTSSDTKTNAYDETDLCIMENTLQMKLTNETTPKQTKAPATVNTPIKDQNKVSKARRRFPWSKGSKPTESYKLKNIYERLLNRPALEAHRAENDCLLALECSIVLAKQFIAWIDENHMPFACVKAMKVGVPLGE